MYRKYYSCNDMPKPVLPPSPPKLPAKKPPPGGGLLSGVEKDDLILGAILLVLLLDGCNDKLLLAALGFLLFDGRT